MVARNERFASVATISRDELKIKIDRGETFALVATLPAAAYHHAHLPGAVNLPPDQVTEQNYETRAYNRSLPALCVTQ